MSLNGSSITKVRLIQNSVFPLFTGGVSKSVKYTRAAALVSLLSILSLSGCNNKFFAPNQIGRFRPVPAVNIILDTLGVAEETPSVWKGAEEPRPADVIAVKTDYVLNPGDVVTVSIFELLQNGQAFQSNFTISETGKISIPEVGVVEASGLTMEQLEEEIKQILSPSILKEPSVVVSLVGSQQYTYSVWGVGIRAAGRYGLPRFDFRLTDAIATAGGMAQFNVSYVYVSRRISGEEDMTESIDMEGIRPFGSEDLIKPEKEMLDIIAPMSQQQESVVSQGPIIASAEMATNKELAELAVPRGLESDGDSRAPTEIESMLGSLTGHLVRDSIDEPIDEDEAGRIEWIFQGGKWVPIQDGSVARKRKAPAYPLKSRLPEQFDWDEIGTVGMNARVIKIPADKLRAGDPRYNIIIKPGDSIQVPVDVTGEYFIYGNVNRQGVASMQGRPMTLKMAIAAAGGLGALAWPRKCEVTRRIGEDKEETVMVDLDKIASGEQPDFFIKPLDLINVGTHPTSLWRAVLRNSFRMTYGFGFVYDRNFLTRDFYVQPGGPQYNPVAPWNWDVVEEEKLFEYDE